MDLATFDSLPLYLYRLDLVFAKPLRVEAHQRAVLWRGAFGDVFRRLVCHDLNLDCRLCPLRSACPFPRIFAPPIPDDRLSIARLRDPPRPFVFVDPHPESASLPAGQTVSLGLALVGVAIVDLPYFVVALRRLGDEGVGREGVKFTVEGVHTVDAANVAQGLVYERGSAVVNPIRLPIRARDLQRPGDTIAKRVRIRFLTPTDVRAALTSRTESAGPTFGTVVRRARDRVSALATFFGDAPLAYDASAVGHSADAVKLIDAQLRRSDISRRSTRTGQRHAIGGVLGSAIYEGDSVHIAMPWLRLAEVIGVGKHATFGNGRIAVEVLA